MSSETISKEEFDWISNSTKNPQFLKLLKEYMDEISDPKNLAEQLVLINEMEVPDGKLLIRPEPWIYIQTQCMENTEDIFTVNITLSNQVDLVSLHNNTLTVPFLVGPSSEFRVDTVVGINATQFPKFDIISMILDNLQIKKLSPDFKVFPNYMYIEGMTEIFPMIVQSPVKGPLLH